MRRTSSLPKCRRTGRRVNIWQGAACDLGAFGRLEVYLTLCLWRPRNLQSQEAPGRETSNVAHRHGNIAAGSGPNHRGGIAPWCGRGFRCHRGPCREVVGRLHGIGNFGTPVELNGGHVLRNPVARWCLRSPGKNTVRCLTAPGGQLGLALLSSGTDAPWPRCARKRARRRRGSPRWPWPGRPPGRPGAGWRARRCGRRGGR